MWNWVRGVCAVYLQNWGSNQHFQEEKHVLKLHRLERYIKNTCFNMGEFYFYD